MCDDRHLYWHGILGSQQWVLVLQCCSTGTRLLTPLYFLSSRQVLRLYYTEIELQYKNSWNSHFNSFYDHRLRGSITKIFFKKDLAPIQTTHSFLHVLCWFLFVQKVENEIYTYTSINFSLVSSIEAKKCRINKGLKNRKIRHKVLLYSGLKIRALNKNEFWRKFRLVTMYTIVNCHWIHSWSLIFKVLNFSLKAVHQFGCVCPYIWGLLHKFGVEIDAAYWKLTAYLSYTIFYIWVVFYRITQLKSYWFAMV